MDIGGRLGRIGGISDKFCVDEGGAIVCTSCCKDLVVDVVVEVVVVVVVDVVHAVVAV